MDEKEWETAFKEAEKTYQEDLVKYIDEIKTLKKDNFKKQKLITKLSKVPESIYPFVMGVKNKIERMESKFDELQIK